MHTLSRNLERHFAKLATIGINADGSISRIAYSDEESAAMAYIRAEAESFGLQGSYDPVGNLVLTRKGATPHRLLVGSHLDSVPYGGNYDGAAGVVAGLEALRQLEEEAVDFERNVDLVVWRGEEHTFQAVYKGSAAAFGLAEPHVLHNLYGNQSLREAMMQQGFDPSYVDACRPSFSREYIDSVHAYLELHIEQGAVLEQERKDVGVVTSIAGDRRFLVVLEGRFDHSGATPMGVRFRSDVNLAMAYIQTRIDALARQYRGQGREFVQTVGIVNADPEIDKKFPDVNNNSVTKVSGLGYFTLDIMGCDDEFLDSYAAEVHRLIWGTAREFGTKAVIEQTDSSRGLPRLDASLQTCLIDGAERVGRTCMRMPSGAGHDAVMVAAARRSDDSGIPVGMVFVPCRHGISHSKDELVTPEQLARGVEVLREAIRSLAAAG